MSTPSSANLPSFEINARSYTLLSGDNGPGFLAKGSFSVPVYQRPYSWSSQDVSRLLRGIFNAYRNQHDPYFLGTMQLMPRASADGKAAFDVVDGQQRLTTLLLFFKAVTLEFSTAALPADYALSGWLSTVINGGKQQALLAEALAILPGDARDATAHNQYAQRTHDIRALIREAADPTLTEQPIAFDATFWNYLGARIYLVAIETRAGLAKTLDIFNTINTAGMDLNGGDVFKLYLYEYLMRQEASDDAATSELVFGQIDAFYSAIDNCRSDDNRPITSVGEILWLYQHLLIATAGANQSLHDLNSDTFFERLFASLLLHENHTHFDLPKLTAALGPDPLLALTRLLEMRQRWEDGFSNSFEVWARLLYNTRYGKYWSLEVLYLYRFYGQPGFEEAKMAEWHELLIKYFVAKTLEFRKQVYHANGTARDVMRNLLVTASDQQSATDFIRTRLQEISENNLRHWLVNDTMTDNATRCRMAVQLLAMIEHPNWEGGDIKAIFDEEYDVEHIRPNNPDQPDPAEDERWRDSQQRLGNLVLLERWLNRDRSVFNLCFTDKCSGGYPQSKLLVVNRLLREHGGSQASWTPEKATQRAERDAARICDFLFRGEHSAARSASV